LRARFPGVQFLGSLSGERLASHVASADVFVFPSKTDTFGIVQLEALASGVPVAAFPVTGPKDVIAHAPVGALDNHLKRACLDALTLSRQACRRYALQSPWQARALQFLELMSFVAAEASRRLARKLGASPVLPSLGSISGPA